MTERRLVEILLLTIDESGLSDRVASFLATCVDDVEQLEILLVLRKSRDRYSSAATVAQELFLDAARASDVLEKLGAKNLVDVRIENDVLYRFAPVDSTIAAAIEEVADVYPARRLAVLKMVGARSSGAARAFADAFRFDGGKRKKRDKQ